MERHLADKKVCAFLVAAAFAECNSTRMISVRLLDSSGFIGALLQAALVESSIRGAVPPVYLQAVCFVRAIYWSNNDTVYDSVLHCERIVMLAGIPWFIIVRDIL